MKKLLFPLLAILLFTACKKEIIQEKAQEEIATATAHKTSPKITICHHDAVTGQNITLLINETAWPGHQAHGDVPGTCSDAIVTICGKDWMVKNLDVSTYRDGTPIPQAQDYYSWAPLTTGAWCNYDNSITNERTYGKLYNWYAVNGDIDGDGNKDKELAPQGWHVPSNDEWIALSDCLGGEQVAGGKMKTTGTIESATGLWYSPNTDATNSSGFTGLPAGYRINDGTFGGVGVWSVWWSSTEYDADNAWGRSLLNALGSLSGGGLHKHFGFSVRCVRD